MEYKGNWRDIFRGAIVAFNFRSMALGFFGILLSLIAFGGLTIPLAGNATPTDLGYFERFWPLQSYAPHQLFLTLYHGAKIIFTCEKTTLWGLDIYNPLISCLYAGISLLLLWAIWSFIGGAICRIAAVDIAKEGERIEMAESLKYASKKYSSFFFPIVICLLAFLLFFICVMLGGLIGRLLGYLWIGPILVSLFLPLALLAGAIMLLIVLGTFSFPLFYPAIATEGTDAFDAVSRGFTYVYSRTWHYIWYLIVAAIYGIVFCFFLFIMTTLVCSLALDAGIFGYDTIASIWGQKSEFVKVKNTAFLTLLDDDHVNAQFSWTPAALVEQPNPYGRAVHIASHITGHTKGPLTDWRDIAQEPLQYKIAAIIVIGWLFIMYGLFYGYLVSYVFTQTTLIYFILRKSVDGIEMNEIFEEEEEARPLEEEKPSIPEEKPTSAEPTQPPSK